MSDLIKFGPYPTTASPPPPTEYMKTLKTNTGHNPHWYTVFLNLYDVGSDLRVVYAFGLSEDDAVVRAAAYVLTEHEKRVVSWLEAYQYLRTQAHDIKVIPANVVVSESLNIADAMAKVLDTLADEEEAKREAEKTGGQVLAAAPEVGPKV